MKRAGDIMTEEVIVCHPDDPLSHAIGLMVEHRIGGLPVLDDNGLLVGMLTEGDFLGMCLPSAVQFLDTVLYLENTERFEELFARFRNVSVAEVMSRKVITASAGDSLGQVSAVMRRHGIRQVPVLQDGHLVGIVGRQDILRVLRDYLRRNPDTKPRKNIGRPFKNDVY